MSMLSSEATGQETPVIRLLRENDLAAAIRLKELAHWNQTESDWRRLLRLEPAGCFAASLHEQIVATASFTTYGKELAWIGMVLVDPAYRRRGVATALIGAALKELGRREVTTVKLDATPSGQRVYAELGFVTESLIERCAGTAQSNEGKEECTTLDDRARAALFALDRRAFGADRGALLSSLIAESCVAPLIVTAPNGVLRGYALARSGAHASYIGPLVATDIKAALALLDGVLNKLSGQEVYLDFNTGCELERQVILDRGFAKQRDLIRMSKGSKSPAGTSASVIAIAGPEVG